MRIFVDCEFNGFGGELISMALVPENEFIEPWYEVVLGQRQAIEPWVVENVMPVLDKKAISRDDFRFSFLEYLDQFESPTICADWYTDLVHFFSMFAGEDHTKSVGYACAAELVLIDEYHSETPHNALSDAKAIRAAWRKFS